MKKAGLSTVALSMAFSVVLGASISSAYAETRVGVTIYKYDDNFMAAMRKDINKEAANYKNIHWLMNDAQNSQFKQFKQIDTLLRHKAKVLVVNIVVPLETQTVVDKAKEQNIPVIFFNREPELKAFTNYANAYYVGADPKEAGKIQAQLIAKHWKANPHFDLNKDGKLQIALLKGELSNAASHIRSQALLDELKQQNLQAEIIFDDTAEWRANIARTKMNSWLVSPKGKDIELVVSNNDEMAIGALDALEAHHKNVPVFGIDALPNTLKLVQAGKITGTVLNNSAEQAKMIVKLVANLSEGKPALAGTALQEGERMITIPHIAVDKDNLSQFLK